MGDGAQYAIEQWVKSGMPDNLKRKKVERVVCHCGKECHGRAGLMQHENAKHGTRHKFQDIDLVMNGERYDLT
jgi:hypothetical protein